MSKWDAGPVEDTTHSWMHCLRSCFFPPSYLSVIGGHPELLPPPPLMLLSGDWAR